MSADYQKTSQLLDIEAALDNVLLDEKIYNKEGLRDALLASGVTVRLLQQAGQVAWVACVANDDPSTHQIEVLAIAIAGDAQGRAQRRDNGHFTATLFSRGVDPTVIATVGLSTIRLDMMRTVLGLEPEDAAAEERLGMGVHERAQRSLRTKLKALAEVAAPLEDVLFAQPGGGS